MRARLGKISRAAAPWLLTILAVQALTWAVLGWSPVLGNLVSTVQLRLYAAQVYPDLVPGESWAGYNPVSSGYGLSFALKNGGGRRALYYDLKSGLVDDERRETVLRMDLGIAESPRVNGHQAFWRARWKPWSPDAPVIGIRIDFRDKHSAPVPDEEAMRAAMADRAMELYEDLSPRTPVHSVAVHYSHEAQEDRHGGYLWHTITVELPEDEPLTREMVLSGKLVTS